MNYTEIKDVSQAFTNRYDADVTSNLDNFLRLAEANISRSLRVRDMHATDTIALVDEQLSYALPADFKEARSIHVEPTTGDKYPLSYLNPEQLTLRQGEPTHGLLKAFYSIEGNNLRVAPNLGDAGNIVIGYYQRIVPLTSGATNNWVSDDEPDMYVAALAFEIESFVKNADAALLWKEKLNSIMDNMQLDDDMARWSGNPLTTKLDVHCPN